MVEHASVSCLMLSSTNSFNDGEQCKEWIRVKNKHKKMAEGRVAVSTEQS